ncbi:MAG: FISUMP domain-containing protein [Bacteroidales bacterium]
MGNCRIYLTVIFLISTLLLSCKPELEKQKPVVTTSAISAVTDNAATCGGDAITDNGSFITNKGVCWSVNSHPTVAENISNDGQDEGEYVSRITGLAPNTTYYVRAYATNEGGTDYGSERRFITKASLITTILPTQITSNRAKTGGDVKYYEGVVYSAKGVCWSTSHNPTLKDQHTDDGVGVGIFDSYLMNLMPSTTYYARAFITCGTETSYGNEVSFTTLSGIISYNPTKVLDVLATMANLSGEITDTGGTEIVERGICWSNNHQPTISDKTSLAVTTNTYAALLCGLEPSTTYYARAYAKTNTSVVYADEVSFTTKDATNTVTDIDGNRYDVVTIGSLTWMVQNLRVTKYSNGDPIPNVQVGGEWNQLTSGAYCEIKNDKDYITKSGRLYNLQAVNDSRKVAPKGWHVASFEEWLNLLLNNARSNLGKAKNEFQAIAANSDWFLDNSNPNFVGYNLMDNNSMKFYAVQAGILQYGFYNIGITAWWGSMGMRYNSDYNESFNLQSVYSGVEHWRTDGCSIRCVKDN